MERRQFLRFAAGGIVGTAWTQRDRAQEGETNGSTARDPTDSDPFDPAVHGFAFSNWGGDTGTGADGEPFSYEPVEVSLSTVQQGIDDSWTTALGEAREELMSRVVLSWISGGAATNGHCYGMVFAADTYYQTPSALPAGVDAASEIPRPTDEYDAVGDRIRQYQGSQLLRAEPYWFALLGLRWGLADHRESLEEIVSAIDATGTAGIALDGEANPHQVLAHGYETNGDHTEVFVYDPTYEADRHETAADVWTLAVEHETGEILEIKDGFDTFLYHDPDMELSVTDRLIGGIDQVRDELSNAVFLGLEAGASLDIDLGDDVQVDRPMAEYADPALGSYSDAVLVLDPPDAFEVTLEGEVGEEYSLDALGLREDELVLEEVLADTYEEATVLLQLSVDEAGELGIEVVDAIEDEATDSVEETAEESSDRLDWIEDNWWLPAAGGALGIGTGYYLLTRRSEDGEA